MRTILLIRHGEVTADAARRYIGRTDLPMSEAGEAQISALAASINRRTPPDAIYCSTLARSRCTAEMLRGNHPVPIHVQPELCEIDMGAWEGLVRREVAESQPDAYQQRGNDIANFRPPGGESFADVACRVLPFWRTITESEWTGTRAIAAHAGVNRVILCHILGMPLDNLFRIAQPPGCLNVIELAPKGPVVRLVDAGRYECITNVV
jgi:alpha-ribazole phosphatase